MATKAAGKKRSVKMKPELTKTPRGRSATKISYAELIKFDRAESSSREFSSLDQAIESDRGRIVFSSPFRRLQNKAQVFPLEGNAAVRSRLTHSLEVAHIGRYLAQEVLSLFEGRGELDALGLQDKRSAFITLVENACLLHDIGNPPFGHFGEAAIRSWFTENGSKALRTALGSSATKSYLLGPYKDFLEFDGNAQGFRIITRLQGEDGKTGLNLTYSQLASYLKYVALPQEVRDEPRIYKKPGYFNTEADVVKDMRRALNLPEGKRFPLAYLMEAADDIAYCMSDIEDGIEKGLITFDAFVQKLEASVGKELIAPYLLDGAQGRLSKFVLLRTRIFNEAVRHASDRFVGHHQEIGRGEDIELIDTTSTIHKLFSAIRQNVAQDVYRSSDAEHVELAGHAVVHGLLERFSPLLQLNAADFTKVLEDDVKYCKLSSLDLEMRLAHMLPPVAIRAYCQKIDENDSPLSEWHHRAHLILDYICGMTDHFALKTFQLLSGIRVNGD